MSRFHKEILNAFYGVKSTSESLKFSPYLFKSCSRDMNLTGASVDSTSSAQYFIWLPIVYLFSSYHSKKLLNNLKLLVIRKGLEDELPKLLFF